LVCTAITADAPCAVLPDGTIDTVAACVPHVR
jgi:hypothetical protein